MMAVYPLFSNVSNEVDSKVSVLIDTQPLLMSRPYQHLSVRQDAEVFPYQHFSVRQDAEVFHVGAVQTFHKLIIEGKAVYILLYGPESNENRIPLIILFAFKLASL